MHSQRYYLGIDGGQSSTSALIAGDSGRVIGSGRGGPCNHVHGLEGKKKFFNAVQPCVREACLQAGLNDAEVTFASVCLGLSGGTEDKEVFARELIRSHRWKFTHDADIALSGALGGEPGIIVIAGTGSMAFGRRSDRSVARAGGWGYVFGDEGGAFDLVRQALRASLRWEEGWGPFTSLHAKILDYAGAHNACETMHKWYTTPRSEIAAFAGSVDAAAIEGDRVAIRLCEEAGVQLAAYASGVYRALFSESASPSVTFAGGVFMSQLIRRQFALTIGESFGGIVHTAQMAPAAGALLEALRLDGNYNPVTDPDFRFK